MEIYDSFCLWSDLLGYGSGFYKSNWDISSEASKENIRRIESLQPLWLTITKPLSETLFTLNDGLVRNFDLPSNSFTMTLSWLANAICIFDMVNELDESNGFPGARGVIAYGQRVKYIDTSYISQNEYVMANSERKAYYDKQIAIYSPSELQMNTAFSKAYIIEGSGSKYGVSGNNLYVDYDVIKKIIDLANGGISDSFVVPKLIQSETSNNYDEYDVAMFDETQVLKYTYQASFYEQNGEMILSIETITSDGQRWKSFEMVFNKGQDYSCNEKSINTRLYKVRSITSSLYGECEAECIDLQNKA